jgi:hypothetical protein
MSKSNLMQNRVVRIIVGGISCLTIFGSTRHITSLTPEMFGKTSLEPPIKHRMISPRITQGAVPDIPQNKKVILLLANSCTKCSSIVISYGNAIENIYKSRGYKVPLITKDSSENIKLVQEKSSWPQGKIIGDVQSKILSALGNPDLPQVAVFEKGFLKFSGKADESLKQSLYRLCIETDIPPKKFDENLSSGAVPCGKD